MYNFFKLCPAIITVFSMSTYAQETEPEENRSTMIETVGSTAGRVVSRTKDGMSDVALTPLEDLNIHRADIPAVLAELQSPYDNFYTHDDIQASQLDCPKLTMMIEELNQVLGYDWDHMASAHNTKQKQSEKLADMTANSALDTVKSELTGLIPFRGTVRRLTGAKRHAQKREKAYQLGWQRRAFLKGIGYAKNCGGAAMPKQDSHIFNAAPIEFRGENPNAK